MSDPAIEPASLLLNVDDHEAARYAKTRILRSAGYTVIEAGTGTEALRLIAERKPVLVLLDVKLPDINGLEVCRIIKADPATCSTLVLQNSASFVGVADRVKGLEGGADTYLTAPIDPPVLVATVGALLRLGRAERELRASQDLLMITMEKERAARTLAERADRLKDEFVATLSHELRTPLAAITGWISILRSKGSDPETLARGLGVIERNSRSQGKLIEDLLDMSRIISGKLRLDVQEVDLKVLTDTVIGSVQIAADGKGILLRQVAVGPVMTYGDPTRLQQIIWNLVSNAIKFTPKGGVVEVRVSSSDSQVQVEVTDTGIGMDEALLPHVFERFRQGDGSSTRRYSGLGIGLSIVKNLAELHGGVARASSAGAGRGSTFVVELPRGRPPEASPSPPTTTLISRINPARRRGGPRSAAPLAGLRILAVDDDPDAREILRHVLTQAGAEAVLAASAEEAVAAVRASPPDLLLSDIGMPDQDGFDLIRRVRMMATAAGGQTAAVALTAMARPEDVAKVLAAGYQLHVPKPFDPNDLVAALESLRPTA